MPRFLPIKIAAVTAALCLASAPVAHAGVSIVGDSSFKINVKTSISNSKPKKGTTMNGDVTIKFTAQVLGLPLPATGYIISSFPYAPFAKPKVTKDNCLGAANYSYRYDAYQGKKAWVVNGKQDFWGSTTLYVKGKAKVAAVSSGYFHGGTGTGHQLDANARDYVKSSK